MVRGRLSCFVCIYFRRRARIRSPRQAHTSTTHASCVLSHPRESDGDGDGDGDRLKMLLRQQRAALNNCDFPTPYCHRSGTNRSALKKTCMLHGENL